MNQFGHGHNREANLDPALGGRHVFQDLPNRLTSPLTNRSADLGFRSAAL